LPLRTTGDRMAAHRKSQAIRRNRNCCRFQNTLRKPLLNGSSG
jgi:hypothetical protein